MICPFFGQCGGCLYQDLTEEQYQTLKIKAIQNALFSQGIQAPLTPLICIPAGTRRRATFALQKGRLGFNARKSHALIEITSCLVLTKPLEALLAPLRLLARQLNGSGDVAVLDTPFGADITWLNNKGAPDLKTLETIAAFCQSNNVARFTYQDMPVFAKLSLPFPPNVFMQPSKEGEQTLVRLVMQAVSGATKALDLFCGLGTFTEPMHQNGIDVTGYDTTAESIRSLQQKGIRAEVRDLFRNPVTSFELSGLDAVVLDPARAGAKAQCTELAASTVPLIVMVSCNPNTFARDAKILLNGGYTLCSVTPVDQFIYTNHVEVVGLFKK